jgi:hypothetical protein
MTLDEVKEKIRLQTANGLAITNDHRITLRQALVTPQKIVVIERTVQNRLLKDRAIEVWLVGQEPKPDGYKIIMREDGSNFGLASAGVPTDPHPVLTGWYGSLISAFIGM